MEKKTFEISQIKNSDDLNALSINLNANEQVSHMKIGKDSITFRCINIDALLSSIQFVDKELVVKEVVDGIKREYDFAKRTEVKHYFMFKNMLSEDDIYVLVEKIQDDKRFSNVEYDKQNKLLMLNSSQKDVLAILRKELFKINPSMEIFEHHRPIRSQDIFDQKYLRLYMRIAILLVAFALALITSKDDTIVTPICWGIVVAILSRKVIIDAWNQVKHFKIMNTDVLMLVAYTLGIVSGVYVETCITALLYQLTIPIANFFLQRSLSRIDETVQMPEKGIRVQNGEETEISLYDFEVGDVMVVYPNKTVHMPGTVQKGPSYVSTYSNTSQYELVYVKRGVKVNSGDVNVGDKPIYIKISKAYESTNYTELMNIASLAPIYESRIEKGVKKIAFYYTPIMFVLSILVGVVLPIIDFKEYASYVHVGAFLMVISGALFNDQSTSLGMLAGFAKAFQNGIIIESSQGLDSINATQVIVYDRFDGVEVTDEEFELFKKLSHMGRALIIFNDGPVALEDDQYTIYNYLTVEEKLEKMKSLPGSVIYIGDSFKDIALLQKSYVGVSRGGLADSKIVENSDIVLIDSSLDKVYQMFLIARRMRTTALINNFITFLTKMILLFSALAFIGTPLWVGVALNIIVGALVIENSTHILE